MHSDLRRTGVNVLGDMPWGAHVCMFYESKDDLLDTVVPFFKAGFESNEFCLWAPSQPLTPDEARMALRRRIPAFDRHLAAGDIEILSGREWYLKGDKFDLKRITSAWEEKLRGALAKGCTYPIVVSGAAEALEVARVHQLAVARRKGAWELINPAPAAAGTYSLTPREREVLWWAAEGKSAAQIGKILHITKRTVDEHTKNATRKLGAANRTQAVAVALRERLIGKSPPSVA
jgi:DNA-binding CsgD family transcriptional regulator